MFEVMFDQRDHAHMQEGFAPTDYRGPTTDTVTAITSAKMIKPQSYGKSSGAAT